MRAVVIMPRSPTITRLSSVKVACRSATIVVNALGSAVLPGNTRTATGQPCRSPSNPKLICGNPFLPSREYPRAANSQWLPVIQVLDRSNNAIFDGLTRGSRCLATNFFSMAS
ncbi:hypothetical protein LAUMK13_05811 [Mycobacterium innocens]|uniref:Uncharacterized protein n=1 Tax=Mycobacterium innocens TaxID=2341083 RepID=A0A498QNH4_9MYCO|nr:hypothetical protein LAUMK13_05811 [Mycobacterium innocens]